MFSDLEYSQLVPSLLVNLVHSVPWSVYECEPVWSASFKAVPHSAVLLKGFCPCIVRTCFKIQCGLLGGQRAEWRDFRVPSPDTLIKIFADCNFPAVIFSLFR